MSDVGVERGLREDLIERRQIIDVPMHVYSWSIFDSTRSYFLVGAHSGSFFGTMSAEKT